MFSKRQKLGKSSHKIVSHKIEKGVCEGLNYMFTGSCTVSHNLTTFSQPFLSFFSIIILLLYTLYIISFYYYFCENCEKYI